MAVTRVTQNMLMRSSLESLQAGSGRMARLQEQLSTGRVLNRPSDSPTDTTSAMRMRDTLAATAQHQRNAADGLGWLGTIDSTLGSVTHQTRQARDLALQGASSGAMGQTSRDALAVAVDQIRANLIAEANTGYLGRPVFGGVTAGNVAFDASGAYVGDSGAVVRTVADNVKIRVDADAEAVFGRAGATVFDNLAALSTALRAGDQAGISAQIGALNGDLDRIISAHAEVGTRYKQVDAADQKSADTELRLRVSLSDVENADLPKVIVDLKLQETAYQASLAATARVMQPSLLDFLR